MIHSKFKELGNDLDRLCTSDVLHSWDRQVRLFARYFLANINLPTNKPFSLLDAGCGTGSALAEIKMQYPKSTLYGCDIDELHIQIARKMNSSHAEFVHSNLFDVTSEFDYIYASNVLEHVRDWQNVLAHLCSLSPCVFVLVPYQEDLSGQDHLNPPPIDHINAYGHESFDFLIKRGLDVDMRIIRTPYAWGGPWRREMMRTIRLALHGQKYRSRRQLLVQIGNPGPNGMVNNSQSRCLRNPLLALISSVGVNRSLMTQYQLAHM